MHATDVVGATHARRTLTLATLVAANLLPLAGVVYWGWDIGALVVLYWSENLIIGAYALVKMLAAAPLRSLLAGPFFLIHYGGFCAVHGVFVLMLAVQHPPSVTEGEPWPLLLVFVQLLYEVVREVLTIAPPEWLLGFAALTVSHGVSLVLNYFLGGEYREETLKSLMTAPYRRVFLLHFAIIAGGFGVALLGSPLPLLVLLVSLKLVLDVWLHIREHHTSAARSEVSSTAALS